MAIPGPIVPQARAVDQVGPTPWQPFGSYADRVLITVYADFQAMFTAFEAGEVDLTDWPIESLSQQAAYSANPDMFLTTGIEEFGIFEMDFNHFTNFRGVSQQENRGVDAFVSPSTKQPTAAGIEVRRAIAHTLDKPSFVNGAQLQGLAAYTDIQAPPAQGVNPGGGASRLSAAILAEDCAAHPWKSPCAPQSGYNLTPDSLADPYNSVPNLGFSGVDDLRAMCDHFVLAGFTVSGGDCAALAADVANSANGDTVLLSGNGNVNFYIRTHAPRRAFGQIIIDSLNHAFGAGTFLYGTSVAPQYFTIGQVSDIVFRTAPDASDWGAYTGGWSLGDTPDHLYDLYHSLFASSACGGKRSTFAQNYIFYCSPAFDQNASDGKFSASLSAAGVAFTDAAVTAHRNVMTIPVYAGAGQKFVGLDSWQGIVNNIGDGFQAGGSSLLNMRCRLQTSGPNAGLPVAATDPSLQAGAGDCSTIRRGFSQEVHKLSLFQATTVWDFEVILQLYDAMLGGNPLTAGVGSQVIDWMTTSHSESYDAVNDRTTQTWILRNDLKFHDGVQITAADVAYTILAYRDVPSANLQPSVQSVISAVALDSRTIQVVLSRRSPFYEGNIGGLPILPKHVWAPICGDPPSSSSNCADPAFDPMQAGVMVGSAQWMCRNIVTGAIGGTCSQTAGGAPGTQDVALGGRIVLTRFENYHRGLPNMQGSSLHKILWADGDNSGKVDILDVASAALFFGSNNVYWDHELFGVTADSVDIGEIATIAFYFDHGITSPQSPGGLFAPDDLDPYDQGLRFHNNQRVPAVGGGATLKVRYSPDNGDVPGDFKILLIQQGPVGAAIIRQQVAPTAVGVKWDFILGDSLSGLPVAADPADAALPAAAPGNIYYVVMLKKNVAGDFVLFHGAIEVYRG